MDMIQTFETFCKDNDEEIKNGMIHAQCIILSDIPIVKEIIITTKNKAAMAKDLKRGVILKGVKGYIVVFDTVTEKKKGTTAITGHCILRTLYTPELRICEYVWYDGTVILGIDRVEGRDMLYDLWDAWGSGSVVIDEKTDIVKDIFKKLTGDKDG